MNLVYRMILQKKKKQNQTTEECGRAIVENVVAALLFFKELKR